MRLLSRRLGISNFAPLKSAFLDLNLASHTSLPAVVSMPVLTLALESGWTQSSSANVRGPPALIFKMSSLEDKLKVAYKTITEGKFTEALRIFLSILQVIPLVVADASKKVDDVKELLEIAKEYVLVLRIELRRKE